MQMNNSEYVEQYRYVRIATWLLQLQYNTISLVTNIYDENGTSRHYNVNYY